MKFLHYWPLALLILIPVIIIFYLLKQRAVEHPYSSVFLWKEMYQNRQSDTPWEKLKKNILMLLQILTLIILILALCSPYLLKGGKGAANVIVVIDSSGSMNLEYENGKSRLQTAKEQAINYVQSQNSNTAITIIEAASEEPILLLSNTKDKALAVSKIRSIEGTCELGTLTDAIDMVRTLQLQLTDGSQAVFFTDSVQNLDNINGYIVNLYSNVNNAYIEYVSYGEKTDGLTVLAKVTNEWSTELNTDINLYGDDTLLAVKTVTIPAGESEVVYFDGIDFKGTRLCAEINAADAMLEDNKGYECIQSDAAEAKVLLVTERNLYLEKAISINSQVKLTKTDDVKNLKQFENEEYDLYIFDCMEPDHLPTNGNVILIGTKYDALYQTTPLTEGLMVDAESKTITKYIETLSFGVAANTNEYILSVPSFAESFLTTKEGSIGFYGVNGTQSIVVLGFDIHDTQLPLTMEFPILIQNMLSECISTGMCSQTKIDCGESMKISSDLAGGDVTVTKPDNETSNLPIGTASFVDTDIVGFYGVTQNVNGEQKAETFAVNFPSKESSTAYVEPAEGTTTGNTVVENAVNTALNLRNYIIVLALLLLCLEWLIYIKQS